MKLKTVKLELYKGFRDLTIEDIPEAAKLVVMIGPNGSGKTAIFDAFNYWLYHNYSSRLHDDQYHINPISSVGAKVNIEFHSEFPENNFHDKLLYIRTSYRHEATIPKGLPNIQGHPQDNWDIKRLSQQDSRVSKNFSRLHNEIINGTLSRDNGNITIDQLKNNLLDPIRKAISSIFNNLTLTDLGDEYRKNFFFQKGNYKDIPFDNLSAGEKAAFELILDLTLVYKKLEGAIYCIDEPELHLHANLQGLLLKQLYSITPESSQLWIATHSIGMIKQAQEMAMDVPGSVVFLNFGNKDFQSPCLLKPEQSSRKLWKTSLNIALGDLATLVAPNRIVICEGKPLAQQQTKRTQFDAKCYRKIFSETMPAVDFFSMGNCHDVENDSFKLISAMQSLIDGVEIIRLVDRDGRTDAKIEEDLRTGIRVLTKRHIESYLLDNEVLSELCKVNNQADKIDEVLKIKSELLIKSIARHNPSDDIKSISGELFVQVKKVLRLTNCGNNCDDFLENIIAPLLKPNLAIYKQLEQDIFGTI